MEYAVTAEAEGLRPILTQLQAWGAQRLARAQASATKPTPAGAAGTAAPVAARRSA